MDRRTTPMQKLRKLVDDYYDGSRRIYTTPLVVKELFGIAFCGERETISEDVSKICKRIGLTVKEKGIGWVIDE